MSQTNNRPIILLTFANDRHDTVNYLRNLPNEARRLREVLEPVEHGSLCEVVVRSNCTAGDIFKALQNPRYRNRIAIFHFGGHANGYQLLLESAAADAGGLAAFLAQQRGLQLVFLNGCSTQQQTQGLLDANISTVISTSRSIDDQVATDFAIQFYQGLTGGPQFAPPWTSWWMWQASGDLRLGDWTSQVSPNVLVRAFGWDRPSFRKSWPAFVRGSQLVLGRAQRSAPTLACHGWAREKR